MNFKEVVEIYARPIRRHPFVYSAMLVVYTLIATSYLTTRGSILELIRAPRERRELQTRVLHLEAELQQQRQLVSSLGTRSQDIEFLRPLRFEESWQSEKSQASVSRLLEYAEFALSKNDYETAERFYSDAAAVQPTITVPYYQGRLAYRRGDLQKAETKWLEAIRLDRTNRYPDLRLYVGILYYRLGRVTDAQLYLSQYLGKK